MIRIRMTTGARRALAVAAMLAASGCSLDLQNPNAPTETEVRSSPEGVIAVAVGMEAQFAQSIDDYMVTNSLVTDEWGTQTRALVSYISLFTGENFDNAYGVVRDPFYNTYTVVNSANTVLQGVQNIAQIGTATGAGLNATARLFKAMALGMAIQQYEQIPIDAGVGAVPRPRAEVLDTVLSLLNQANDDIASVSDADLATFRSRVLANSFDLRNTINAMLARYSLIAGDYAGAIAAADRVTPGSISLLEYPSPTRNPIENLAFQLLYVGGLQSFVDEAEPGDRRPTYWVNASAARLGANPTDSVIKPLQKYSTPNEPFPVYLPDEIKLIKAEALTRQGQFGPAATLVNEVRTQTSSTVDEPVAGLAALPATALDTEAELLAQIAYERRYELYEQGLRWEDTRRFGPALTTTPTLPWLPLPQVECTANPANPCG